MFGKLTEAKQKMEEVKARVEALEITGEAENGAIQVLISGNKMVKDIRISPALLTDAEALQDLLMLALNRAMQEADKRSSEEMKQAYNDLLPGLGGLLNF